MSIVVTGFGPFKSGSDKDNTQIDHVKNASWEGVKAFAQKWDNPDGKFFYHIYLTRFIFLVTLNVEEIEVAYEAVNAAVDRVWSSKPRFVIHLGVAGRRASIDLEMKSTNGPYDMADVRGALRDPPFVDGPGKIDLMNQSFMD